MQTTSLTGGDSAQCYNYSSDFPFCGLKLPLALFHPFRFFLFGCSCLCRFGLHSALHCRKAALLHSSRPRPSVAAVCLPHSFTHRSCDRPLQNLRLQTPLARSVKFALSEHCKISSWLFLADKFWVLF